MLTVDEETLAKMEGDYPGIVATIRKFEEAQLPACPRCRSDDTADVQCGVVGRTIKLAFATTKVLLIANGPKQGRYFCRACEKYFG